MKDLHAAEQKLFVSKELILLIQQDLIKCIKNYHINYAINIKILKTVIWLSQKY